MQGMLFAFFEHVACESVALEGHSHVTPFIQGDNRMPEMQRLRALGSVLPMHADRHKAATRPNHCWPREDRRYVVEQPVRRRHQNCAPGQR